MRDRLETAYSLHAQKQVRKSRVFLDSIRSSLFV